ncbi:MAG: anthranilate synthase component I, partial [Pyrinomonadaceae bacterium]|nr:anthranilate synthase component I [Pyrinomonadaceae bacterium]
FGTRRQRQMCIRDRQKAEPSNVTAVVDTMPADLLTPLAVYLKLAANKPSSFLLESVEGGETLARYSFIGTDPVFTVSGNDQSVMVRDGSGETKIETSIIDFLREHFRSFRLEETDGLPSSAGGAIGYFGFACSAYFEPTLRRSVEGTDTDAEFMFCRTIVAFDHAKQVIKIVSLVIADEANEIEDLKAQAAETNRRIRKSLENDPVVLPVRDPNGSNGETTSNFSRSDFESSVRKIKEYIAAGDAYQVVLSQRFSRPTSATPVAIYRAMRSLNPSPYMFLIRLNGRSVIGASPEMLVRSRGSRLEYRPIAGTRPRGENPEADALLADEMRADRKEVAEHLMLVDLGRNDLGRVAAYGTVKVDCMMNVEKYSHVQHLVSNLSAELREGADRFDALAACFPAGTVSGAPKVRAIEIISELEPTPRGLYSGAVGYFDYTGNMDTCIAIRTMVLENGVAHVQAGAGIVADSDPASEFEETVNKASALLRAVEIAEKTEL